MVSRNNSKVIKLSDLWLVFVQRFWIMLLIAIVCMVGLKVYESQIKVPMYESTATLYILRRDNELDYTYTQSDFKLALDVVNDCTYVLKSREVLQEVQHDLKLDCSLSSLAQRISTNNPENTRFLEITVTDPSPETAKDIVNCLCDKGSVKIEDSMGFDQVNLYSYGVQPSGPSNMIGLFGYMLLGLIVMLIIYSIFLIAYYLDDKVKTSEDISERLGVSVLAEIPNNQTGKGGNGGKYRYQNAKKYQYRSSSGKRGDKRR